MTPKHRTRNSLRPDSFGETPVEKNIPELCSVENYIAYQFSEPRKANGTGQFLRNFSEKPTEERKQFQVNGNMVENFGFGIYPSTSFIQYPTSEIIVP